VGIAAALLLLSIDQSTLCHWYNFVCQARVGTLETMVTNERPRLIVFIGITAGLAVMTKAWIGLFAFAIPLLYALITGELNARRKHWSLAMLFAGAIILPWHLWQIWMDGKAFLYDYLVVNVFGRMTAALETHQHGPSFTSMFYATDFPSWDQDISGRPLISGPHGLHGQESIAKSLSC
jgi:4-amino-4-deoxy-L-arabinose transferase-like glycosyltransferase